MRKLLKLAVSVSMSVLVCSMLFIPSIVHADDDGSSLLALNTDITASIPDQYTELIASEPVGVIEEAASPNYSVIQAVTGAALTNEYLTEDLTSRLNYYLVDSYINGSIDVQKYDEIVNSGLISDNAFFANSVFVGDSLTVGFESYCKSKSSIATDTTYFLARVSGSAKACISSNALTKYANIMPKYNGKVQLVEDSISQMPNVEKMFICYGMNDLTGSTPTEFVTNMQTLINRIKEKNPQLSVYVISIPCVVANVNTGYLNNKNIQKANILLQDMCTANGYGFINIFEHLMGSNNAIRSEYSSDNYVHETTAAYAVWNKVLKDYAFEEITK